MCPLILYNTTPTDRYKIPVKNKTNPSMIEYAMDNCLSGMVYVAVMRYSKCSPYYSEPLIEEFPTDTTAIEGEGVFFKVVVRGYPQPSLTWYHEDTQLTSDYSLELTQDGSLSITSTELKHIGVYKLLAKNSSGSVEREVRLTVRQEEEEAAPVARERVDVQPVSVAEFGDYVAYCHSNSDEMFKYQYMVRIMLYNSYMKSC